jgi:hypothetical protein
VVLDGFHRPQHGRATLLAERRLGRLRIRIRRLGSRRRGCCGGRCDSRAARAARAAAAAVSPAVPLAPAALAGVSAWAGAPPSRRAHAHAHARAHATATATATARASGMRLWCHRLRVRPPQP